MKFIFLFIFINFLNLYNSYIIIKFGKYLSINKESKHMGLGEFVTQKITNVYVSEIYLGEPLQILPGFLKTSEYAFTLSNYECPHAVFFNKEKSKTFKFTTNKKYYNFLKFYESLFFYSSFYSTNYDIQATNFTITADNQLMGPQCFHIGTQLLINQDEKDSNLMDNLHKNKYIKTYYYEYKIYEEDEIYLVLGLDENFENNNKYKFIKPIIAPYSYNVILKWGLTLQNLFLNNYTIQYKRETRAEFDINCGCLLGNIDFRDYFKNYLKYHDIPVEPKRYEKEYYVYFFEKNMTKIDIIKNINLQFYHKELNFYFSFDFNDLFLEKNNGYYFLIVFECNYRSSWKFGFPFFKKYHFIFNHDSKIMGLYCPNGCPDNIQENNLDVNNHNIEKNKNKNDNEYNNMNNNSLEMNNNDENKDNINIKEKKSFNKNKRKNLNFNKIFIIFLGGILIVSIILFFGILIGKKIFGVRKKKVNELLELYDYSVDNNKP